MREAWAWRFSDNGLSDHSPPTSPSHPGCFILLHGRRHCQRQVKVATWARYPLHPNSHSPRDRLLPGESENIGGYKVLFFWRFLELSPLSPFNPLQHPRSRQPPGGNLLGPISGRFFSCLRLDLHTRPRIHLPLIPKMGVLSLVRDVFSGLGNAVAKLTQQQTNG